MRSGRNVFLISISCVIVAIAPSCKRAAAPSSTDAVASCRQFAQSFYDWYVPFTQAHLDGPAWNVVLERKPDALHADLFKALKADSDAQAHATGELAGIDFDPFVSSQDPANHYEVRGVRLNGKRCFVDVWSALPTDAAENTGKPNVTAELAQQNGRWQFLNVRYPELGSDLLSVLAELRKNH